MAVKKVDSNEQSREILGLEQEKVIISKDHMFAISKYDKETKEIRGLTKCSYLEQTYTFDEIKIYYDIDESSLQNIVIFPENEIGKLWFGRKWLFDDAIKVISLLTSIPKKIIIEDSIYILEYNYPAIIIYDEIAVIITPIVKM